MSGAAGPSGRAAWILVALLVLVAGGVFWLQPWRAPASPARLQVTVLDLDGLPVPGAQVRLRRGERAVRTDDRGQADVPGPLPTSPEGGRPEPELIRSALEVDAPFLALRRNPPPQVEVDAEGRWRVTLRMTPYGLLRVRMDASLLPGLRAELETDPACDAEPEGGRSVVRMSKPVSWRVYPPTRALIFRAMGDTGAAMQRIEVAAPSVGHVVQHTLTMPRAEALVAAVASAEGLDAPTLSGQLWLVPREDQTRSDAVDDALPIDPVRVPVNGMALAPHTANRPYLALAVLDFLGPSPAVAVKPGEATRLPAAAPAAWVELQSDLDAEAEVRFRGTLEEPFGEPATPTWDPSLPASWRTALEERARHPRLIRHAGKRYLVFEQLGTWRIGVSQPGSTRTAPTGGTLELSLRAWGAQPAARLELDPRPHGALALVVPVDARASFRGASVEVHTGPDATRTQTVLPRSEGVTLAHLPAGSHRVRILWRDASRATTETTLEIRAGETTTYALPTGERP